jgi:hypothetical protein
MPALADPARPSIAITPVVMAILRISRNILDPLSWTPAPIVSATDYGQKLAAWRLDKKKIGSVKIPELSTRRWIAEDIPDEPPRSLDVSEDHA